MSLHKHSCRWGCAALLASFVTLYPSDLAAQGASVGGHVGVALPVAWRSQGSTETVMGDFSVSFPTGIILRKNTGLPIDLAVFPTFVGDGVEFGFGIGTARGIGHGYAAAIAAFVDVSNSAWGIAPAVDKVLADMGSGKALVADLMIPVQFNKDDTDHTRYTTVAVAMHLGFVF